MPYNLDFITRENLKHHVKQTVLKYLSNSDDYNLRKLNKNIIDPIKLLFDQKVYSLSDHQLVVEEVRRQLDKSNNNAIGYFHQNLFRYIDGCRVPAHGFDIIYRDRIFVELKNKHNTMNSASAQKTYMKLQHKLLEDDQATCYLVEIISRNAGDSNWRITLDGREMSHAKIRRCSIDRFLALITGDDFAFKKLCDTLPEIIEEVLLEEANPNLNNYSVISELDDYNASYVDTFMQLAFGAYNGFD